MPFPNAGVYAQSFTFRDAKGNTATLRTYINADASTANPPVVNAQNLAGDLRNALVAATNAAEQSAHGPNSAVGVVQYGSSGAGDYIGVSTKGLLVFQDAGGNLHRFALPAPKIAIFEADGQTINPGNSLVNAIKTAWLAVTDGSFFCSKDGTQLVNFMGGVWQGRALRRKLNILVLTPALTAGLPAE